MANPLIEKAIARIPEQLRRDEFRFVPINFGEKRPFEPKWNKPDGNNYPYNSGTLAAYLIQNYNWGTCTGMGDLIIFDSDNEPRLKKIGVSRELPATFSVRTGGGGLHRYYVCHDHGDKIIMFDRKMVDDKGKPLHLGEVQTMGFQAVGPGSTHPNGNKYRVEVHEPITEVEWDDIFSILDGRVEFGIAETTQKTKTYRVRHPNKSDPFEDVYVEDIFRPHGKVKERDGILTGSHPIHGSTGGQNFQVNTKTNSWFCFRCWSGGGPALAIAVKEGLIDCKEARKGVLRGELYMRLVEIARDRGYIDTPPRSSTERVR